ncbi:MAG: M42 family metallopeptidase [Bacillota bacterium]
MISMKYILEVMEKICCTASPTGYTQNAMKVVETELVSMGYEVSYTRKGALTSIIKGKNEKIKRSVAAHIDTLGAMVKEIKGNGRIAFTNIGGYAGGSIESENCNIHTSDKVFTGTIYTVKPSVHIHSDARTLDRTLDNMEILLDERVSSAKDVQELGISVGDFISFESRFRVTEKGYIKSRHLDDKASVAIILGVCKYIRENNIIPEFSVQVFISNYEEVGHGASSGLSPDAEELLCVDMGTPGIGQNTDEYTVSICAKDSSGPYDYELRSRLTKLAEDNNIGYKVDIYPNYSSDGAAALQAGMGLKVGLIGPGVYASHTYERTHKDSVECAAKLLVEYIRS